MYFAINDSRAVLVPRSGVYSRPISTDSREAQQFFDQGLRLTYAFNHSEALRSFKEAVRLDPDNATLVARSRGELIISPLVLSHLMTQVALWPEVQVVFDELITYGGADITFRPLTEYTDSATASFDELEAAAAAYVDEIDELGGAIAAIDTGYQQRQIQDAAYRTLVARVGVDAVVDMMAALLSGDIKQALHFARDLQRQGIRIALGSASKNARAVLGGLDLEIPEGEFLALMGPSGSGKSTLLNLIGGLDRASSGEIHVNGMQLEKMDENQLAIYRRKQIGFIFQSWNHF